MSHHRTFLISLLLLSLLAGTAFADDKTKYTLPKEPVPEAPATVGPTDPATVTAKYDGQTWEDGRHLATCVQTGMRSHGLNGAYTMEVILHKDRNVASIMVVDTQGNLWNSIPYMNLYPPNDQELIPYALEIYLTPLIGATFGGICERLSQTTITFTPVTKEEK